MNSSNTAASTETHTYPKIKRSPFLLILFLGFLNALTPFTIDLYLPAFSDIARDLNTIVPRVSLTIASYFVGFAIGQIIYGPLLDRFGRKPPILIGLLIYILASLGCMTTTSVEALMFFRFLSAVGGAAASVGTMTMVRDYFPPQDGAKVFSMLMLVLSTSPLLAPTIGGWIATAWGWRVIFGLLSAVAILDLFIVVFGLPKAYEPDKNMSLKIVPILKNFREILRVKKFRTNTIAGAFSFSGLFVYLAGSPSIFIDGFGVSKQQYGYIFAFLAAGMIGGGQLNNLFIKKFSSEKIFRTAVVCQVLIGLFFLTGIFTFGFGLFSTISVLFFLLSCAGVSYPNAAALALSPFTKNAGSASSLLGFIQMGLGALLASCVGIMNVDGPLPTALVMTVSAVFASIMLLRSRASLSE